MVKTVEYTHKVRLSEAIYGTKFILLRNGRKLEVKIPSGIADGARIKLTNALSITDGSSGDINVQIQVEPRPVIIPTQGTNIDNIFQFCLYAIGGISNDHVRDYIKSRNNKISRRLFFEKAVWAIWVAGWGQKQCETFLSEAIQYGFSWNHAIIGKWNVSQLEQFMRRKHLGLIPERARKKWEAVHTIAGWLNSFPNDDAFRQNVFRNIKEGKYLDKQDVSSLRNLKKPFIGEANSFLC